MEFVNSGRAQLKIQQMAFMLIAVTLFFVLVGLFFLSANLSGIKRGFITQQQENAKEIANVLSKSPEFGCGHGKIQCIDLDKAMQMKNRVVYQNFWEADKIIIRKIYPVIRGNVECTYGNYPNCNVLTVFSHNERELSVPGTTFVSLCHKEFKNEQSYEQCDLGLISISFKASNP